jgi:nucleoside-diphosphate-sugar epimerase
MTPGARSVIVTGASSFIGAHLIHAFADAGYEVTTTLTRRRDSYTGIRAHRLDTLPDTISLVPLDIRDEAAVGQLIKRKQPGVWIHHAGYATRYGSPDYDLAAGFENNVDPLHALYRHCAEAGTGILVTGSGMEYGTSDEPNREDNICLPETPYALCKLTETLAARQLALRYDVPTRVARVFNLVGPLDDANKILPSAASALKEGRPVELSPCTQRRDFIAVEDLCAGYIKLARDLPRSTFDLFNLSSGHGTVLKDLLSILAQKLGADPALLRFGAIPMRPGEPPFSAGANDKAKTFLKWHPRPIEEILDADLVVSATVI